MDRATDMGAGTINRGGGRKRRRRGGGHRPMSEINVTPFVDVMLVLLIIFMVAAPLLTTGVPIELPKTTTNALPAEDEQPLTISLTADGQVIIQETEVEDMATFIPKLRAIAAERNNDKVFLRADGSISYEAVMQVMGALNQGGFHNIGLVTDSSGLAPETDGAALEEGALDLATDELLTGLRLRPASAGSLDGLGFSPAMTAKMVHASLLEAGEVERLIKLQDMIDQLDPAHFPPPVPELPEELRSRR